MEHLQDQTSPLENRPGCLSEADDELYFDEGKRAGNTTNGVVVQNTPGNRKVNYDDGDDDYGDEINAEVTVHPGQRDHERFSNAVMEDEGPWSALSREEAGRGQVFVHSYTMSTKKWRRWASRVATTSNLHIVLRNVSLLHCACSFLLTVMGVTAILARGFLSYLAIPIWTSLLFFLPTCITGLQTRRNLHHPKSVRYLKILSILSAILSIVLCIMYAACLYRDGQFVTDCEPLPGFIITASCRQPIYRVLISAVTIFLFVMELIASIFTIGVCCIVRPGCLATSADQEQLISRTSMSYKRLESDDELTELTPMALCERPRSSSMNTANKYQRSVSAPSVLANMADQDVVYAD